MDKPKGVIYANMADGGADEAEIARVVREAIGWTPDPVIDSNKRNCYSSLLILLKANRFAAASLREVLRVFSRIATKYKNRYGRPAVVIIDNANKLDLKHPELLDLFQDYAKIGADERTLTIMFVSSEGRVPRRMGRKSIMFEDFFDYYVMS